MISISYLALATMKLRRRASNTSLMSLLAAGIFAAQMINWPIPGGTSLHFVGGALAGIVLGPWLGFLSMFLVLLVQCIVFHDGGITALGANVLNMAIIDVLVGYFLYKGLVRRFSEESTRLFASFLGGWIGITLAGLACGLEIGYSPSFPYGVAQTIPIMVSWHLVLGLVEGIITASIVMYLIRRAPHLLYSESRLKAMSETRPP